MRLDPRARSPRQDARHEEVDGVWEVVQVVSDDAGDDDWAVLASVDLAASAEQARPVVTLREVSR